MATPRTMTGARAKVGLVDTETGNVRFIGIFDSCSYSCSYTAEPIFILGRYSAADTEYTAAEVVSITCSGFRVLGHGWHRGAALPALQDLMRAGYIEMTVVDRLSEADGKYDGGRIAKIKKVRPTGGGGGYSARQLSQISMNYIGLLCDDESTENNEHPTAMDLPAVE